MDIHSNLVIATIAVAPDPAESGTTLSVSNADGERFADPEGEGNTPYNVTVFPPNATPDIDNAEIVRITAKDVGETDTEFTIIREQEETNAREIQVGDKIAWTITKKTIVDIEDSVSDLEGAMPSGAVVGTTDTQALTNKRITKRVYSVTDAATITPNGDSCDWVDITAIAQPFTIANPTGTPTNKQVLIFEIKDNGTGRAITWGNGYVAGGAALPTTTVASKILTVGFAYSTANSLNKWRCVASVVEE